MVLVMQVLLQKVYNTQHQVTCLILKLVADIVEAHISFAQVEEWTAPGAPLLAAMRLSSCHMPV